MAFTIVKVLSIALTATALMLLVLADDNNEVYSPCSDTTIQRKDGFAFGLAFMAYNSSFIKKGSTTVQLSPCDSRLNLANSNAQVAVFRPKVDEISILTITSSHLQPENYGAGYMVAFAGSKYAARSNPAFVGNSSYIVTSFTLVLEFQKGRLNNLYWKRDGCAACKNNAKFVCLNDQDCALKRDQCSDHGGKDDCSLGVQLAFSGTDKHYQVLNSWYEVENLQQYSLYGLYSNLKGSISNML